MIADTDLCADDNQLIGTYESIFRSVEWGWPPWDEPTLHTLTGLAASRLAAQAAQLPPSALARWLDMLDAPQVRLGAHWHAHLIDAALNGLGQRGVEGVDRDRLMSAITRFANSPMNSLRAWVGLHELGRTDQVRLWPDEESEVDYLRTMPWAELAAENPRLVNRARWLAQLRYPHLILEPVADNRANQHD
jgi:hypothetical protein